MNKMLEKLHSLLLKYVIDMNIYFKAALYLPLTMTLSVFFDFYPLPDSYFNYTDNILNRGFMKINYVYCLIVLLPFAIVISYTYSKGNFTAVIVNVIRTVVVIVACLVIRRIQPLYDLESSYNHCSRNALVFDTESKCTSHGYEWIIYQLSGHMLYSFYYSLAIMEEMRLYKIWQSYVDGILEVDSLKKPRKNISVFRNMSEEEYLMIKRTVSWLNGAMKSWIIITGVLIIVLDFCTLTTLVYFHQIEEKVLGSILAIVIWYMVYKCAFSSFILKKIARSCNHETISSQEKFLKNWYSHETRKMYYYKNIQNFTSLLQPNFDI